MSYEAKYLKYKNKYLALKAQLKGAQMSGGGGKLERTETETTLSNMTNQNNSLSESMDNLFKQLGGATRSRKSSRASSRKASKKSSRKSRGSRSNFFDDSDEEDDDDIMDKMNDEDDDFSSSELDW